MTDRKERYPSLDLLRGVAVLLVMVGHFLPGYFSTHVGWTGVDLFFVLSGFFVSGILFQEYQQTGHIRSKRFLVRRGLKIWPLFYTGLIVQLVYLTLKGQTPQTKNILVEIFFVQNYIEGFLKVTWSLGIEEQFYLILALVTPFILKRFGIKQIVTICIFVMISCLVMRIVNYTLYPNYDPYQHFFPLHLRADSLCGGILISWVYHFKKNEFISWVLKNQLLLWICTVIFLLPVLVFAYTDKFILTFGFTTTYLAYSSIVILLLVLPIQVEGWKTLFANNLLMVFIAWIGFYSYAIYLFHFFIGFGVVSNFKRMISADSPIAVQLTIFMGSNILFGYLISRLMEQPILRWRNKIFPAYTKGVTL